MTRCPKCRYQRQAGDDYVHPGICPRCGIAYTKYRPPAPEEALEQTAFDDLPGFRQRLWNTLSSVPEATEPVTFWGRAAVFVVFVFWGVSFIAGGIDWEGIGGSFMHNVNLPFHEFGHVLFGFFGRFMGILGGSLLQILVPLVFVFAFTLQMQDNFAGSICLWWCGQNFIDISPYIADAPQRSLPLILGMSESYHDWGNLLTMTDSLEHAEGLARASFAIGSALMILSFAWGSYVLWLQYRSLRTHSPTSA